MADIDFVVSATRTLMVGGLNYDIAPVTMRQIPALARLTEPLAQELRFIDLKDPLAYVGLLSNHGDAAMDAVALMVRVQGDDEGAVPTRTVRQRIEHMNLEEFIGLAMVCVEVNADFFIRALANLTAAAPKLAPSLLQKLQAQMATGTTPTPSTSS